jgi:hypothetical protein
MTEICVMSSAVEMHVAGSKTDVKSTSTSNKGSVKKGTMTTMVPITTNLIDSVLPKGAQWRRIQGLFPQLEEGVLAPELQTDGD